MSAFDLSALIKLQRKTDFFEWLVAENIPKSRAAGDTCIDTRANLAFPLDSEYERWVQKAWPAIVSKTVGLARKAASANFTAQK